MRVRLLLTLSLLFLQTTPVLGQFGSVQKEDVAVGLNEPMDLAFLPDGRALIAEKRGRIKVVDLYGPPGAGTIYLDIPVSSDGERGLTSIALHPNFETEPFVYAFYLPANSTYFRLSRFGHVGLTADIESEEVIWQDTDPAVDCCHFGGGLVFDDEGYLYLALGDKFNAAFAQDLEHTSGKILRLYPDGAIPADNPFIDGPGGVKDEIFALGIRNPFRMSYDSEIDRIYVGEVGSNYQVVAVDDIHVVELGANFGWPFCEGLCDQSTYSDPVYVLPHDGVGASITCGDALRLDAFPPPFRDRLMVGDYAREEIRALAFDSEGMFVTEDVLDADAGAVVAVKEGPDGNLYSVVFSSNGSVVRYRPLGSDLPPTVEVTWVGETQGVGPLALEFTAMTNDPEGLPIAVEWLFGDGTTATGSVVSKSYALNGVYSLRARVSDVNNSIYSEPVEIQVGLPPVVTLATPIDGSRFRALDVIGYSASATDPDGDDALVTLSWRADFLHDSHTHTAFGAVDGPLGDFQVDARGHDYHDETGYRIIVRATDEDGLFAEASTVVWPEKVELTFDTNPSGMSVVLDGIERQTPFVYDSLVGFEHDLSVAEKTCFNETRYSFVDWSDAAARERLVVTPGTSTTIIAEFQADGPCDPVIEDGLVMQFDASRGVTATAGVVQSWDDLSGTGNNMIALGQPLLIEDELNGLDVVRLDGTNDELGRFSDLQGLPVGNAERTMFMVAKFTSVGWGGVTYGNWDCKRAFGLGLDPDGDAMVNLWCDDVRTNMPLYDGSWQIMSVARGVDEVELWLNQFRVGYVTSTLNTGSNLLRVGVKLDGSVHIAMDVAEILLYDRELGVLERLAMQDYLRDKYLRKMTPPVVARWLGMASADWSDATNWSAGVPDATQTVSISATGAFSPTLATGTRASCRRLVVEPGATLTIEVGGSLACEDGALLHGTTQGSGTLSIVGQGSLESAGSVSYRVDVDTTATVRFPVALMLDSDLTIQAGSVVVGGGLTVAGSLTMNGGTLTPGGATASLLVAGDAAMQGGSFTAPFPVEVQGSWSATDAFTPGDGAIRMTGSAATLASLDGSPIAFDELRLEGSIMLMDDVELNLTSLIVTPTGALDLGTYTLVNVATTTSIEGALVVGPGGTLMQFGELVVPGALSLIGIDGMPAKLVGDGESRLLVQGSVAAHNFEVRAPGAGGFEIASSVALGLEPLDLRDGRFSEPVAGGVLLAIDRDSATSLYRLDFEAPNMSGGFNVTTSGPGALHFLQGGGTLIGEIFEDDPLGIIDWSPLHSRVLGFDAVAAAERATLTWTLGWAAVSSNFHVEHWDGAAWIVDFTVASDAQQASYSFDATSLTPDVPVMWRLSEDVPSEPLLVHATATATPWTASIGGAVVAVGPNGSYATIQEALDAATGEALLLLIEPGLQPAFSVDGVTAPTRVHIIGGPTQVDTSAQALHIHDVPLGAFVGLTDLEFVQTQGLGIFVENCVGSVVLDELVLHGPQLVVDDAERFMLHASDVSLGSQAQLSGATIAYVTNSTVDTTHVGNGSSLTSVELAGSVTVQGGGAWNDLPGLMPGVAIDERLPIGVQHPMTLRGAPNSVWVLASSAAPAWTVLPSATIELPLMVDPIHYQMRQSGTFDGTGSLDLSLGLPANSASVGREYYLQMAEFNPTTMRIRFSNLAGIIGLP